MRPLDFGRQRTFLLLALTLLVLLALPSLRRGFNTDDLLILSNIEQRFPDRSNSFDIYASLIEQIELPWWAGDDADSSFMRPLSSLLLRADHALFGRHVVFWRAHSIFWFALLLLLAHRIYRRHFPVLVGGLALLLLALDESNAYLVGWIANRQALVAATLGCGALVAQRRWRLDDWKPGLPLAVIAYVASLAAGETGLAFLGYGFCFEVLGRRASWRSRISGASVTLALLLGYGALYKLLGYGTRGSGIYVDPGSEPLRFLAVAAHRIPLNLAGLFAAIPPDPFIANRYGTEIAVIGVVATLCVGALTVALWKNWSAEAQRELKWLLAGAALSLIPAAGVAASHRLLLGAMIGVAPLLSTLVVGCWRWFRERTEARRWWAAAAFFLLAFAHLVAAPVVRLVMEAGLAGFHRTVETEIRTYPEFDKPMDVVLVKLPGLAAGVLGRTFYDEIFSIRHNSWTYLSIARYDHVLSRIDATTFELSLPEGEMITTPEELFWAQPLEFRVGKVFSTDLFDARIVEMGDVGITRVRFEFHRPLDSEDMYLGVWQEDHLERLKLPEPGHSMVIPHSSSSVSILGP